MTALAFLGERFSRTHENQTYDELFLLVKDYCQDSEERVVLIGNVTCNGHELDAILKTASGIIENLNKEGTCGGIFIDKHTKAILMETGTCAALKEGDPVRVLMTQNPVKEDRWEAWCPQPLERLPEHADITPREGDLKFTKRASLSWTTHLYLRL